MDSVPFTSGLLTWYENSIMTEWGSSYKCSKIKRPLQGWSTTIKTLYMRLQVPNSVILPGMWFRRIQSQKYYQEMCLTITDFILKYAYNFHSLLKYCIYDTKTVNILITVTENTSETKKGKHRTRQRRNLLKMIIWGSNRLMIKNMA